MPETSTTDPKANAKAALLAAADVLRRKAQQIAADTIRRQEAFQRLLLAHAEQPPAWWTQR